MSSDKTVTPTTHNSSIIDSVSHFRLCCMFLPPTMTRHSLFLAKVEVFAKFFIVGLIGSAIGFGDHSTTFNVFDFGAVGDGVTDDTEAFLQAWNATCRIETPNAIMVVPGNKFLVYQISFVGPCVAKNIMFLVEGDIVAPESPAAWSGLNQGQWIVFVRVDHLHLTGPGTVDGRGSGWWGQSCRYHPHMEGCTRLAPTAVKFISCKSISISNMSFLNSPQAHISIIGCRYLNIDNLLIEAPGESPNTDGIHIQSSQDITIARTVIRSGDDCISIGDYTSNIDISYIVCGPGHGVSIGSLGRSRNFVRVENIRVSNVYFSYTTNGARIKTWQVGEGYVRRVLFEDIRFDSVKNPIIIDQNYCEVRGACQETLTGVAISNVTYRNMFGTSKTEVAINLNCSKSIACTGIILDSIKIVSAGGRAVTSSCTNAFGSAKGVQPWPCLQNRRSSRTNKAVLQYMKFSC